MRILVACEESQAVTREMRRLGHEAYSCDIQPCSGDHPEWHLQVDALELLKLKWDMIIAHPPCTHLCSSGARWFTEGKKPRCLQEEAAEFFMKFAHADCPRIAIENPIGVMSTMYRRPDQIIQPWQFGHGETKATCLWLKGLPNLSPTEIVGGENTVFIACRLDQNDPRCEARPSPALPALWQNNGPGMLLRCGMEGGLSTGITGITNALNAERAMLQ